MACAFPASARAVAVSPPRIFPAASIASSAARTSRSPSRFGISEPMSVGIGGNCRSTSGVVDSRCRPSVRAARSDRVPFTVRARGVGLRESDDSLDDARLDHDLRQPRQ